MSIFMLQYIYQYIAYCKENNVNQGRLKVIMGKKTIAQKLKKLALKLD